MKDWIATALLKRKEKYSTVIVLETSDPERGRELTEYLRMYEEARNIVSEGESVRSVRAKFRSKFEWLSDEDIKDFAGDDAPRTLCIYDPFEGLTNLQTGERFSPVKEDPLLGRMPTPLMSLQAALEFANGQMQKGPTVLVIKNISERRQELAAAVRSWATSPGIYEKGSTVFLLSPASEDMLDSYSLGLVAVVPVPISEAWEREALIKKACPEVDEETIQRAVVATSGLDLHGTESAVLESLFQSGTLDPIAIAQFKSDVVKKSGVLEIFEPAHGFDQIGGYDSLKTFVRANIIAPLKNPVRAAHFGVRIPRGLLLFGPPGTGKSWFAKALAKELGIVFITLKLENIFGSLVGESEHKMKLALKVAESMAPDIIFVDEADRVGQRTDTVSDSGVNRRIFSMLLEYLGDSDRRSLIVGTTNEPQILDPAFTRVGRFDFNLAFFYPDMKARLEILRVHTSAIRKVPLGRDVDLKSTAKRTEYFSGAEVEELVVRAARGAFNNPKAENVMQKDFELALKSFKIDTDSRLAQLKKYEKFAESDSFQ